MNNANKVYKNILQTEINTISKKISTKQSHNKLGLKDTQIEKLKIRRENLQKEIKELEELEKVQEEIEEQEDYNTMEEKLLNIFEQKIDKKNDKTQNIQERIQELEKLRSEVTSTRRKNKYAKKIKNKQEKLKKLQKRKNRLDNIQKTIMLPKHKLNSIKKNKLAKAEAKVNVAESNLQDIEKIKASLNPEESIRDDFKMIVYDVKEAYYRTKLNRVTAVLEEIRNKKTIVAMHGANVTVISKNLVNKFRNKLNSNELDRMTNNQNQISEQPVRAR